MNKKGIEKLEFYKLQKVHSQIRISIINNKIIDTLSYSN